MASERGEFTGNPRPSNIEHPFTNLNVQLGEALRANFAVSYPNGHKEQTVTCHLVGMFKVNVLRVTNSSVLPNQTNLEGVVWMDRVCFSGGFRIIL